MNKEQRMVQALSTGIAALIHAKFVEQAEMEDLLRQGHEVNGMAIQASKINLQTYQMAIDEMRKAREV